MKLVKTNQSSSQNLRGPLFFFNPVGQGRKKKIHCPLQNSNNQTL